MNIFEVLVLYENAFFNILELYLFLVCWNKIQKESGAFQLS